jgi:high-affinity iron transporter
MLPTFVIGLREGLEAALIVGIIAAFLRKQGRRDLLRSVLFGVAIAVLACVAAGVALEAYSHNLPQRQQEGLETIIGALAVGMVTYMVVWMRRNSRQLKGQLEGMAASALAGHSSAARAMVLMAFLAVIREGLETVVFLLAAFNETGSGPAAGFGAVAGIAVAIALGYGIYRGGVRLNLSKFFRATGLVLVLVAAGLVVNALHTAHEAGWLNVGQGRTVDLTWLVEPGTVQASLLTGMLGIQPRPVLIEVLGWLVYLVPVGCFVACPPGRPVPGRLLARAWAGVGVVAAAAAAALVLAAPARPAARPVTSGSMLGAAVTLGSDGRAVVRTADRQPVAGTSIGSRSVTLTAQGLARHQGLLTEVLRAPVPGGTGAAGRPLTLPLATVAKLNNGRLPIGVASTSAALPASYRDARTLTLWVDTRTGRVVDFAWAETVSAAVRSGDREFPLSVPVAQETATPPATAVTRAVSSVRDAHGELDRRSIMRAVAGWCAGAAVLALLTAVGFAFAGRRQPAVSPHEGKAVGALVRS